jgi:hypothetical protein
MFYHQFSHWYSQRRSLLRSPLYGSNPKRGRKQACSLGEAFSCFQNGFIISFYVLSFHSQPCQWCLPNSGKLVRIAEVLTASKLQKTSLKFAVI